MAVVVAVPIVVAIGSTPRASTVSLGYFGVVIIATVIWGPAPFVSPASVCRIARSVSTVSVLVVAAATILVLVAVPPTTRFVTSVTLAVTFLIFVMLLTLAFLLLVEASGHLLEPAVRDLVCAVHDTAQDELLHRGLSVCGAWRSPRS
jgi:hypothetical protein